MERGLHDRVSVVQAPLHVILCELVVVCGAVEVCCVFEG